MSRLSHPLLGRDPVLVGGTIVFGAAVSLGVVLQYVLGAFVFVDDRFLGATWLFDGFVGAVILGIGVTWIVAIVYGWTNGGPLLAAALAVVPMLIASAVRLDVGVTVDHAVAFAAATLAVWLAAWAAAPPGNAGRWTAWMGALGGGVSGVAALVVWRGTRGIGPYATDGGIVAWTLFSIGVASGLIWMIAHWRALNWPDWRR